MSALPTGWVLARFPELVFFQEGPGLRKHQYREAGVPFLNIRTFIEGRIDKSLCKFLDPNEVANKYQHFLADRGDILIAISGSIGKWAIVTQRDLPILLNTSIMRFRPLDSRTLDRDFLLWSLRSPEFTDQAWGASTGSAQRNVGPSHVQGFTIKVPPLPEQRRIVAKIDSLTGKSRRARDHLDHIPRLVQKYKQAVLAAAFRADSTADWKHVPFERVVSDALIGLVRGKNEQSSVDGTPYIRMNHYDLGGVWNENNLTRVDVDASELYRFELRDGDILFNTRNSFELVGKVAIWVNKPRGYVYNNNLLRLRLKPDIFPAFAFYQMISPPFRAYLDTVKSATTSVCAIYQRSIMAAPWAYPSKERQIEIALGIDAAFAKIDILASEAKGARRLLARLDDSILAKAFRGELVPQDPSDEPASILLERIKADRSAAPRSRRERRPLVIA